MHFELVPAKLQCRLRRRCCDGLVLVRHEWPHTEIGCAATHDVHCTLTQRQHRVLLNDDASSIRHCVYTCDRSLAWKRFLRGCNYGKTGTLTRRHSTRSLAAVARCTPHESRPQETMKGIFGTCVFCLLAQTAFSSE